VDEPQSITAGDTLSWSRVESNYPPSAGWTLNYALQGLNGQASSSQINFAAGGSGNTFSVNVAAATSGQWPAGAYTWTAFVTNAGSGRHTIGRGSISILPDPQKAVPQTHARRALALIECAIEGRIPRGLENHTIDGQTITKIPLAQLVSLRDKYRAQVLLEPTPGRKPRRTIGIRFVRP
jgi:hypothetical protein